MRKVDVDFKRKHISSIVSGVRVLWSDYALRLPRGQMTNRNSEWAYIQKEREICVGDTSAGARCAVGGGGGTFEGVGGTWRSPASHVQRIWKSDLYKLYNMQTRSTVAASCEHDKNEDN